jgi:hypothetical protein
VNRLETLAWLADVQQRFGELIRTPLDRRTGSLRAPVESYSPTLRGEVLAGPEASAVERLAVYHRQYWFRLYTVLQSEYPLTARLLGMWSFNELASHYVTAHAPRSFDLQHVAHELVGFLTGFLPIDSNFDGVARTALLEAAAIDRAFSQVFLAPEPTLLDARAMTSELSRARLKLAPTVALIAESWPLMELRKTILDEASDERRPLPSQHAVPQYAAVFRIETSLKVASLEPVAYRLFTLLTEHDVSDALAALETTCDADERAALPGKVQALLRDSVSAGFWAA